MRSSWSLVVRGGVEPPTFRFSAGCAGPGRSIAGRLTGPTAALAPFGIQGRPHVSTAFVSKALARSPNDSGNGRWASTGGLACHRWRAARTWWRRKPVLVYSRPYLK